MQDKYIKTIKYVKLIVIMLMALIIVVFCGNKKEYLYQDEILSYTGANHPGGVNVAWESHEYITGNDILNTMETHRNTADGTAPFDFSVTWDNQRMDQHPPLYYGMIHFVTSLFPDTYSKWYGLSVNMIALVLMQILMFMISKEIFVNFKIKDMVPIEWLQLGTVFVYTFSIAVMTQVMFIRMYMVLQVFTAFFMLCHLVSMNRVLKGEFTKKNAVVFLIQIFAVTAVGTCVHYYYLVFAFFVSAMTCLFLLVYKKIKELIIYAVTMLLGICGAMCIFPYIFEHLFFSYEGAESFKNVQNIAQFKSRLMTIYVILNQQLFGSQFKLFVFVVFVFAMFAIYKYKKENTNILPEMNSGYRWIISLLVVESVCYYAIVAATTPYLCDRYFSPIFSTVIILIMLVLYNVLSEVMRYKKLAFALTLIIMSIPYFLELRDVSIDGNKLEMLRQSREYSDKICVVNNDIIEENYLELMNYENIYVTDMWKGNDLGEDDDNPKFDIPGEDSIVIYIPSEYEMDDYMEVLNGYGFGSYERLYVAYQATAYLVSK